MCLADVVVLRCFDEFRQPGSGHGPVRSSASGGRTREDLPETLLDNEFQDGGGGLGVPMVAVVCCGLGMVPDGATSSTRPPVGWGSVCVDNKPNDPRDKPVGFDSLRTIDE